VAIGLNLLGDRSRGLALHKDTLDRRRRILGDDHPDTLDSMLNVAISLAKSGAIMPARRMAADAVNGFIRVLGSTHPRTRSARKARSYITQMMGGRGAPKNKRTKKK
jgi:hypothetical protein